MAVKRKKRSVKRKEELAPENIEERNFFRSKIASLLRRPKVYIALIIILFIAAAFYLKGLFIVAVVNGQPITRLAVVRELERQNGEQVLSSIITETLILQEAQKRNITVSEEELDASVKEIENQLKEQGQDLNQALAFQGMDREDFEEQLRLRNLVEKMLADDIEPTEEEVSDYIEENKDTLPEDLSGDELQKSVKEQLKQQRLSSKVQEWLKGLQEKATINHFVSY